MLQVNNLSIVFDQFKVDNISFSIDKGDYFVLLGRSGAGKSLVLELLAGLIVPNSGTIHLENKNITFERIQLREVGLVFQDYAIFPHLNVFENIAYSLYTKKIDKKIITEKVHRFANELNIMHLLARKPATLSGGELQRVALARTLILEPKILLLDEPLSSLDVQLRKDLRSFLRRLNKNGQTIIHVTHDYEEALSLANKVAVMHNGSIIQQGTPKEVFETPENKFIADFTGVTNFFKAEIKSVDGEHLKRAYINNTLYFNLHSEIESGEGFVRIDDTNIIVASQQYDLSTQNNFKATVTEIIPARFGHEIIVNIGIDLSVSISDESLQKLKITEGTEVWIAFKAASVKFIPGNSAITELKN